MMPFAKVARSCVLCIGIFTTLRFVPMEVCAKSPVIYAFKGGSDGGNAYDGLIKDKSGDLYGTTTYGGGAGGCNNIGCGTVFKLSRTGQERVLYAFSGGNDGGSPFGGLILDAQGNLYGMASEGGTSNDGVVFKVAPNGAETVLHTFAGGSDGQDPLRGLTMDKYGNLYGTTSYGGSNGCASGCGTVFKLAPDGTETILHAFTSGTDGTYPISNLIWNKRNNLYGTTYEGGSSRGGIVFKIAPNGVETILWSFGSSGSNDGLNPDCGLLADSGNLYGTTDNGGASGMGTIFEITSSGSEKILHSFSGSDGADPRDTPIMDRQGNLFGTTAGGGAYGYGTVFELTPAGGINLLLSFNPQFGATPFGGLLRNGSRLYGTATDGGSYSDCYPGDGCGIAFAIKVPEIRIARSGG